MPVKLIMRAILSVSILASLLSGCQSHSASIHDFRAVGGYKESNIPLTLCGVHTHAELYTPSQQGKHPAVVLLYGTGGMVGAAPAYRWYASSLASAEIVTIICPFFDTTHGHQHRQPSNTRVWIPAVRQTITYLQQQPDVDPSRIGIIGFSLGSFVGMSTMAEDNRVKAFVDFFGPEPNLTASEIRHFPPALILHGSDDNIVGISNSRELAAKLNQEGIAHELVIYKGQHHGFTNPDATDTHTRAVNFLAAHLEN